MKHVLESIKSGDWRSLLACFLYFDTGFTVWGMFGPLAPFIRKNVAMSPLDQGLPQRWQGKTGIMAGIIGAAGGIGGSTFRSS